MSKIRLVEMGPRDGLQNESTAFSPQIRAEFIKKLVSAGVRNIEVGAFVSPKWVPQMQNTQGVYRELLSDPRFLKTSNLRLISLVPNTQGLEDALKSGTKEIAVFTAASELFSKKNTNASVKESLTRIKELIPVAKKNKIKIRGYISTCFYCPFEGKISNGKVLKIVETLADLGVYEISIGDTIGAAVPSEVKELNKKLVRSVGRKMLAMHFHDTRGTALANIYQSLQDGITAFDSSLGGLGGCPYAPGAAGNVATEDVVYMLHGMGYKTGYDLIQLKQIRHWISEKVGRKLKGASPFQSVEFQTGTR
jgi:hydroxymethylglutaryl-CoA lyase